MTEKGIHECPWRTTQTHRHTHTQTNTHTHTQPTHAHTHARTHATRTTHTHKNHRTYNTLPKKISGGRDPHHFKTKTTRCVLIYHTFSRRTVKGIHGCMFKAHIRPNTHTRAHNTKQDKQTHTKTNKNQTQGRTMHCTRKFVGDTTRTTRALTSDHGQSI